MLRLSINMTFYKRSFIFCFLLCVLYNDIYLYKFRIHYTIYKERKHYTRLCLRVRNEVTVSWLYLVFRCKTVSYIHAKVIYILRRYVIIHMWTCVCVCICVYYVYIQESRSHIINVRNAEIETKRNDMRCTWVSQRLCTRILLHENIIYIIGYI